MFQLIATGRSGSHSHRQRQVQYSPHVAAPICERDRHLPRRLHKRLPNGRQVPLDAFRPGAAVRVEHRSQLAQGRGRCDHLRPAVPSRRRNTAEDLIAEPDRQRHVAACPTRPDPGRAPQVELPTELQHMVAGRAEQRESLRRRFKRRRASGRVRRGPGRPRDRTGRPHHQPPRAGSRQERRTGRRERPQRTSDVWSTELVRRGASTTAIQHAGGRKDPQMVARYASAVSIEDGAIARYFG